MKAQMIEKNGFPKPIGFMLIFLMISLVCLAQCLFSQSTNVKTTGEKFDLPGVEEEAEIQVEAWMVNDSCWNNGYISEFKTEECEPEISVEAWIVNF